MNAGLEGFARAAALEAPRGIRVNVVSPPWVSETLTAMGQDPKSGVPAADVARAYVESVEGSATGTILVPGRSAQVRVSTVVNVGYRATNYWVVSAGRSRLLVDLGYPGTMGTMRANLHRTGVPLEEIRYGLATHYHPDHAGLAQELKQAGVPLLVLETQVSAIPRLKKWTKPRDRYVDITMHDNVVISFADSRAVLAQIGIAGEIVPTPGHSDDSVSLLLDDGSAFTGDLTPPALAGDDNAGLVATSWRLLRERSVTRVYPGHGPVRPMHAESGASPPADAAAENVTPVS